MSHIEPFPGVVDEFSIRTEEGWDHTYLSNGFIEPDGSFVEREYQAAKAADPAVAAEILACTEPFGKLGSKKMGRNALYRPDWELVKFQVMSHFVLKKFTEHEELGDKLVSTGNALLVEGNGWHDNIWGDCKCGGPDCQNPGLNWLGHVLMVTRDVVKQQRK